MKKTWTILFLAIASLALCGFQLNPGHDAIANSRITAQDNATLDPTGFESPDEITVSYASSARTITLTQTGGVILWWRGTRINMGTPWVSGAHDTGNGVFHLACRTSATPEWTLEDWTFDMAQIAEVSINASDTIAYRECHGLMPWTTHESNHLNIGTYRSSGLTADPTTYAVSSTTYSDANNTPGFIAGVISDEDCNTAISSWTEGTYSTLHFTGTGVVNIVTVATLPMRIGANYPMVNVVTGGTFSEAEAASNNYLNYYQLLLPVTSSSESQKYRQLILQPQVAHATLAAAQAEDYRGLNLGALSAEATEFVAFTKITYRTSASYTGASGKCRIEGVSYLSGNKASQVTISGITAPSLTSLGAAGINGEGVASTAFLTSLGTIPVANGGTGQTTLDAFKTSQDGRLARVIAYSTIATNSVGPILTEFNTEQVDNLSAFGTSVFVAPSAGVYLINAQIIYSYNASGFRDFALRLNDTDGAAPAGAASYVRWNGLPDAAPLSISRAVRLSASDKIEFFTAQNSGSTLTYQSYLSIIQLTRE